MTDIVIPDVLRPADGRFGSGPSKVRPEAVSALADASRSYLGTSHRQATVRNVVGRARNGIHELFGLPTDYEVLLGEMAQHCLSDLRYHTMTFGIATLYVGTKK